MTEPNLFEEPHDFSLVLGGPIFQLFRRSHLAGEGLELLHRRLLIITLVAWLPLMLLATLGSSAGTAGRLSFFHDIEVHVRFLVATAGPRRCRADCSFAGTSCSAPLRRAAHRLCPRTCPA